MCASIFSILTVKGSLTEIFTQKLKKKLVFRKKCQASGVHGLPPPVHRGRGNPQGVMGSAGGARHQGRGGLLPRPDQQPRGNQIRYIVKL